MDAFGVDAIDTYLVSYYDAERLRAGLLVGTVVVDMEAACGPVCMRSFIEMSRDERTRCFQRANEAAQRGDAVGNLSKLRLGPPIADPGKIICLGLNYRDHAAEAGLALPTAPVLFAKYSNSLIGPHDDIIVPAVARAAVDYEAELAVVIGETTSRVTKERALDHVFGYAAFNDVTARDLQFSSSQWGAGKAIDTFGPLGPAIVPRECIPNPQDLALSTTVNGVVVQHAKTSEMIFTVAETIAYISSFMTLEPGDLIATGTPAGVGFTRTPKITLTNNDIVEVAIDHIGVLRNKIVWEPR